MKKVELRVENFIYDFYEKIGKAAGKPIEEVMVDSLFRFAGELATQFTDKERGH